MTLARMTDNSSDGHFSGVRLIYNPYLTNKLVLASLRPIMTRYGLQMNRCPKNDHYCATNILANAAHTLYIMLYGVTAQ